MQGIVAPATAFHAARAVSAPRAALAAPAPRLERYDEAVPAFGKPSSKADTLTVEHLSQRVVAAPPLAHGLAPKPAQ